MVLSLNAAQYKGFLEFKYALFNKETCYLSIADKEMIGLVLSSTIIFSYYLTSPSDVLRGITKDPG